MKAPKITAQNKKNRERKSVFSRKKEKNRQKGEDKCRKCHHGLTLLKEASEE